MALSPGHGAGRHGGPVKAMRTVNAWPEAIPGTELRPYYQSLLERWDATPRQGLPQFAGGQAAFLWRGHGEAFASLHMAVEEDLREAWNARRGPVNPDSPPGLRLPAPGDSVVRGFTISPDGTRIAALLSTPHSELADVWVLAVGADPARISGATAWYAAPVWEPDGAAVWILTGKPPSQKIMRCALDSEHIEELQVPSDLGDPTGCRLSLTHAQERLQFKAKAPGTDTRAWELVGDAWRAVPASAFGSGSGAGLDSMTVNRLAIIENHDNATLTLDNHPVYRLSPVEFVKSFTVHDDGDTTVLWLHTASPERPSGVVCLEVPASGDATACDESPLDPIVHRSLKALASDGIEIPLVISVRAADLGPDGSPLRPLPLIITCYGGFGVKHRTEAEPSVPAWLESGGVYVAAQLRGGGELGGAWHDAGRGPRKMRTIQDLIDVAHYLTSEGWTTGEQTVAVGASHGGMVVTAAALLSPASFGGIVATAPLLDTVNLHRHGLGRQWLHEFGADGESTELSRASFSPIHLLTGLGPSAALLPPILCCLLGRDERVDNSVTVEFVVGIRDRGGPAWLLHEDDGSHGQRGSADVLSFSSAVLAFASSVAAPP